VRHVDHILRAKPRPTGKKIANRSRGCALFAIGEGGTGLIKIAQILTRQTISNFVKLPPWLAELEDKELHVEREIRGKDHAAMFVP